MSLLQAHPSPLSPRNYDDDFLRQLTGTGKPYKRKNPATRLPYHASIDLPPKKPRVDGDPIYAVWDGTIQLRSFDQPPRAVYGKQVSVVADDGYGAFYAHLADIVVKEGERVKAGQLIGHMGNTGSQSVGTHLHFEKRRKWADWLSVENPYAELRALENGTTPSPPIGGDEDMAYAITYKDGDGNPNGSVWITDGIYKWGLPSPEMLKQLQAAHIVKDVITLSQDTVQHIKDRP